MGFPVYKEDRMKASPQALKLAEMFIEHRRSDLGFGIEDERAVKQNIAVRTLWAFDFDQFHVKTKIPFERIEEVLLFYVTEYRKRKNTYKEIKYINTPLSFLSDFTKWSGYCDMLKVPVPVEELAWILDWLKCYTWPCEWEYVVTAVSQSVASTRAFKWAARQLDVEPWLKDRLYYMIYDGDEYVRDHFLDWRDRRQINVFQAVVSLSYLCGLARREMADYGCSTGECDFYVNQLYELMKQVS